MLPLLNVPTVQGGRFPFFNISDLPIALLPSAASRHFDRPMKAQVQLVNGSIGNFI